MATQEELQDAKTKLAEMQIVQTEVHQTRSVAYAKINSLNAEIAKLQQTVDQLQNQRHHSDEIYALQTQVRFSVFLKSTSNFYYKIPVALKNYATK